MGLPIKVNLGDGQGNMSVPQAMGYAKTKNSNLVDQGRAEGIVNGERRWGSTADNAGGDIARAGAMLEARTQPGGDAVTEALKQQKQQSQANVNRNMAGHGVSGGVAAAASEQAGRAKDIDIAASAYQQNAQNIKDYANFSANIASNLGQEEQMGISSRLSQIQPSVARPQQGLLSSIFS